MSRCNRANLSAIAPLGLTNRLPLRGRAAQLQHRDVRVLVVIEPEKGGEQLVDDVYSHVVPDGSGKQEAKHGEKHHRFARGGQPDRHDHQKSGGRVSLGGAERTKDDGKIRQDQGEGQAYRGQRPDTGCE